MISQFLKVRGLLDAIALCLSELCKLGGYSYELSVRKGETELYRSVREE